MEAVAFMGRKCDAQRKVPAQLDKLPCPFGEKGGLKDVKKLEGAWSLSSGSSLTAYVT